MTAKTMATGVRWTAAILAVIGSAAFAIPALIQPLWFVVSAAPVGPHWAALAWTAPLAGLPAAALAYFAVALALSPPEGAQGWEALAGRCLMSGLWGAGAGALWAGLALGAALAFKGFSDIHGAGAGLAVPMVTVLLGLACVVAFNGWRTPPAGAWESMGHVLWGLLGVAALTTGASMLIASATIDDVRTLVHRYNLFVVFYPLMWLAYAGVAVVLTGCGIRWMRFACLARDNRDDNIPAAAADEPTIMIASPLEMKRAA